MFFKNMATIALTALLSTLSLSQMAQAKDLRIVQKLKKSLPLLAKKNLTKKISPICANFNGKWEGTCVDSDGEQESWISHIFQDGCELISIDGMSFNINGLNTVANSPSPNSEGFITVGGSVSTTWNDAQTRLYQSIGYSFSGFFSGVSTQEIWLEGDSLRMKDTANYNLDKTGVPSPVQMIMEDCTLTRR